MVNIDDIDTKHH